MKELTHKEFSKLHKEGKIEVGVRKYESIKLALSPLASKYNKPAVRFWFYLAGLLFIILPIPLWIFKGFFYGLGSFVLGMMVYRANKESTAQFVINNMLEDEKFYNFVMSHKDLVIINKIEK